MKKLVLPIALLCAAIHCERTHAAFVNITIENENGYFANHPSQIVQQAWIALGGTLDVYRIYANFESNTPQDHVFRVFAKPGMPTSLTSSNGMFYNYVITNPKTGELQHFDWPLHESITNTVPSLAWDTFATLGFGPFLDQGGIAFVPGNHLQESWTSTNVWWTYGTSFPSEGDAVPGGPSGFRVGLFQATVAAGVQVSGQFALDTGQGTFWGANTAFTTIPAPGALALLTFALIAPRRRRL